MAHVMSHFSPQVTYDMTIYNAHSTVFGQWVFAYDKQKDLFMNRCSVPQRFQ